MLSIPIYSVNIYGRDMGYVGCLGMFRRCSESLLFLRIRLMSLKLQMSYHETKIDILLYAASV